MYEFNYNLMTKYMFIVLIASILTTIPNLLYAASDPFATIQTHLDTLINTYIKVVQGICLFALVTTFCYCVYTTEINKVRILTMVVSLVCMSLAKSIVTFFMSWGGGGN